MWPEGSAIDQVNADFRKFERDPQRTGIAKPGAKVVKPWEHGDRTAPGKCSSPAQSSSQESGGFDNQPNLLDGIVCQDEVPNAVPNLPNPLQELENSHSPRIGEWQFRGAEDGRCLRF